jgi:hypothetical protein
MIADGNRFEGGCFELSVESNWVHYIIALFKKVQQNPLFSTFQHFSKKCSKTHFFKKVQQNPYKGFGQGLCQGFAALF